MCELYPAYRTCCGIPTRIALIFIAISAIVTGAMLNAAIKKAGVNVGTIQEVKDFTKRKNRTDYDDYPPDRRPWRARVDDEFQDVKATTKKLEKTTTKSRISTIEIVGEDGRTEVIRFQDDDDHGEEDSTGTTGTGDTGGTGETGETTVGTTTIATTKKMTKEEREAAKDTYTRVMGQVNRNGLNILAVAFILLGIILFVTNFLNSPEMALLWVVMCLAVCVGSLVLLLSVLGECARAPEDCLLHQLDWFSAFMVSVFCFVYVFVWAFFAAVANGLARDIPPM